MQTISVTITTDLLQKIDNYRGDIPKSRFIYRLLESSLKNYVVKSIVLEKKIPVGNSFEANHQQMLS